MASGNWSGDVIQPKPRCRLCRRVVEKKDMVRLDGVNPSHRDCAVSKGRIFTDCAACSGTGMVYEGERCVFCQDRQQIGCTDKE